MENNYYRIELEYFNFFAYIRDRMSNCFFFKEIQYEFLFLRNKLVKNLEQKGKYIKN